MYIKSLHPQPVRLIASAKVIFLALFKRGKSPISLMF